MINERRGDPYTGDSNAKGGEFWGCAVVIGVLMIVRGG